MPEVGQRTTDFIVVIPCGGAKRGYSCPAGEMYVGAYHRGCLGYALTLVGGDESRVFILSSKYGLLSLGDMIAPYDLRMGNPGSVGTDIVKRQAKVRGISGRVVVALGGKAYTDVCRSVWSNCKTPLTGVGGIGKQLQWLKRKVSYVPA